MISTKFSSNRWHPRRGTVNTENVYHVPVLTAEAIEALAVKPDGTYLDATAGGGGHLKEILARLDKRGTAIGIDRDPDAIAWIGAHVERGEASLVLEQSIFSRFDGVLSRRNIAAVDGLLLDLGISSHQIDACERGFSYMKPVALDMRMDPASGMSAADFCAITDERELARVLSEYGDITNPLRMARAIKECGRLRPLQLSTDLVSCLKREYGAWLPVKVIAKVFQALRIAVNGELTELAVCLSIALSRVKRGGRIVVISYHSLEDRVVKNFFRDGEKGCVCPPVLKKCVCGRKILLKRINKKVIIPSAAEIAVNPRARSARLRAAEMVA
jgi:16S rRNA (cytosine1402-N4)-methyltransferase